VRLPPGRVSIRSRLFGREKLLPRDDKDLDDVFQSAPGFSAGRNDIQAITANFHLRFNPLPAFRPGETSVAPAIKRSLEVSIRSRLFGREKRIANVCKTCHFPFQSAPGFSAGRNTAEHARQASCRRFNPLPAFRPGETGFPFGADGAGAGFNPLPAFRPGETVPELSSMPGSGVSIRSRLFGREKHGSWVGSTLGHSFQSAPGFSAGRNLQSTLEKVAEHRFNPLPAFRPGETTDRRVMRD